MPAFRRFRAAAPAAGPEAVSARRQSAWEEVHQHVAHALPDGWHEVGSDSSQRKRFALMNAPELGETTLDPRYLPNEWTMSLTATGTPIFQFRDMAPVAVDPRGAGPSWRMMVEAGSDRTYWTNDDLRFTTYLDPRGLPDGWELRQDAGGRAFFVDGASQSTSWQDPRAAVTPRQLQRWRERDLRAYVTRHHTAACGSSTQIEKWPPSSLESPTTRDVTSAAPAPASHATTPAAASAASAASTDVAAAAPAEASPEGATRSVLPTVISEHAHRGESAPIVEWLRAGGCVDAADATMGATMLMSAAACGHISLVDLLLSHHASVSLRDAWGCTALLSACCPLEHQRYRLALLGRSSSSSTRIAVVTRLLEAGATIDEQDNLGLTALHVAIISRQTGTVNRLLQYGACPDVCDSNGRNALSHAAEHGDSMIKKLLMKRNPAKPPLRRAAGEASRADAALAAAAELELLVLESTSGPEAPSMPPGNASRSQKKKSKGKRNNLSQGGPEAAIGDEHALSTRGSNAEGISVRSKPSSGEWQVEVADAVVAGSAASRAYGDEAGASAAASLEGSAAASLEGSAYGASRAASAASASVAANLRQGAAEPPPNSATAPRAKEVLSVDVQGDPEAAEERSKPRPDIDEGPEDELLCPISHTLLTTAVMTSSGHLYNEAPLRQWLSSHPGEDPISRQPIADLLAPAYAIRAMANRWAERGYN